MKKSVEIIGQPVVSITEGKEFGQVKDLVINPSNGTVAALVIDDGKWYLGARLLPFAAIAGLGENAVTISNSADITGVAAQPEYEQLLEADVKIIGTKVLTKGGKIKGKINEIIIDPAGKIEACEMEKADGEIVSLPAQDVVTFGKAVLIVSDTSEPTSFVPASTPQESPAEPVQAEPQVVEPIATEEPVPQVEIPEQQPVEIKETQSQPPADDSAKKFDDKHRKFLLGKKAARRIETDNGVLIVEQGGEITEEVLQKAKLAGKFVELSMNIQ
ncbi:PRC-barrel domain-containing protein [Sporomusa aerivorans]|uniref:PRC-barrel domain-containing protein n=1 Tax=Sporomusa aerivorans TaxID=204936 RepID=UPI00352B7EFE